MQVMQAIYVKHGLPLVAAAATLALAYAGAITFVLEAPKPAPVQVGASAVEELERDRFWLPLRVNAEEREHFETLEEMGGSADLVVTGRFASFEVSRVVPVAEPDVSVVLAKASLELTSRVAGQPRDRGSDRSAEPSVEVEFLIPAPPHIAAEVVTNQAENLPTEEMLFALRDLNLPDQPGLFRLVNSRGLWFLDKEGILRMPMVPNDGFEEPEEQQEFKEERGRLRTLADLAGVLATGRAIRDMEESEKVE